MSKNFPMVPLRELLIPVSRPESVAPEKEYRILGAHWYAKGLYIKDIKRGSEIQANKVYRVEKGDFVYNRLFAWKGSFAVATGENHDCYVSNEFPCFKVNQDRVDAQYSWHYFSRTVVWEEALGLSTGGTPTSRNRLKEEKLLAMQISLPSLSEQRLIVARIEELATKIKDACRLNHQSADEAEALFHSEFRHVLDNGANNKDWEIGPIPNYAEINPSKSGKINFLPSTPVAFVPMSAVDDVTGCIIKATIRPFAEVSKGYTCFKDGDIIFARITPCMQNGKTALAEGLSNGIGFGSTEFHVLRPGPKIMGRWLHIFMRHKDFRKDAAMHFKGTAGQQRVPQNFLEQKMISVPPISEQRRIVAYLDNLQSKIDELKRLQAETEAEINALLPSILDKAFKGEL